jgi:undecaprenyl diphosphate synthase
MSLLVDTIQNEMSTLLKNNVRLSTIGDINALPKNAFKNLQDGMERSKHNTGLNLNIALNYSGRWELTEAVKAIAQKCLAGEINPDNIESKSIDGFLSSRGIPDPELLIRTSGEMRISNFMLWQLAYTELYFTNVLWPDFRRKDLLEAIKEYQRRERRFGKVSEE